MSTGYPSPFTGPQVDAAVSAVISGGITSQINTASAAAVSAAAVYTDAKVAEGLVTSTIDTAAVSINVLSGGVLYNCSTPVTELAVASCTSNSIGDVVAFTAAAAGVQVDLPPGLIVLVFDEISSGASYDLMVCDNRVVLKEVVEVTQ